MRLMGGALKIRLVEINHAGRWNPNCDWSGFENFVIQRDGQFRLPQARADEQAKMSSDGAGLRNGFAANGVSDWSIGQFNYPDDESTMKPEIDELPEVYHRRIQTPITPIVHPKMNSGKEPFKCGMDSAECGVRPI